MQVIDQAYEVVKTLGQGLAGEVYLVKKDGQLSALKLLKPNVGGLSPQEAEAHFKAEFAILKQLSHPHIAQILDFGTDRSTGRSYYTTEYIEGGDLFHETRNKTPEEIEGLFIQGLRALEYLSAHGIAHYDLKPENLLVRRQKSELKIIDFGLAGFRPRGRLAGTPAYMAPEIVLGERPDHRADLYSLGLSIYECLTGKNPFREGSVADTLRRQETLIPSPAIKLNPHISEALSETLQSLLQKNPADRPPSASAALRMLAQLSGKNISLETEATSLSYLPNETKLIGRQSILEAFAQALQAFSNDSAEATDLWIQGEAGLGKSRLLSELRYKAQLAGLRVVSTRGARMPDLNESCVLLWDDADSGALRRFSLTRAGLGFSVLLVAASTQNLELEILSTAQSFKLQAFNREELHEYLSAATGITDIPKTLVQELYSRSSGHPRDLSETLRDVIRRGGLFDEHGRWTQETLEDLGLDLKGSPTPQALSQRLESDLHKLDQPARTLLQWLALAPGPVSAEGLQKASGQEELSYWILELLNKGWVTRDDESQAYRIANPALIEILLKLSQPDEIFKMHQAWAKSLENSTLMADRYRYHLGRSGKNLENQQALLTLAQSQEARGDWASALQNLELADQISNPDPIASYDVKNRIVAVLLRMGKKSEALQNLKRMQEQMDDLPANEASARIQAAALEKMGVNYLQSHSLTEAQNCFQSALKGVERLKKDFPQKSLIFKNYLGRIAFQEGRLAEAKDIFIQTRQAAETLKTEQRATVTNNDLGMCLMSLGEYAAARDRLQEDLHFFQAIGREDFLVKCLYNLGEVEAALAHPQQALDYYRRSAELAKSQKNFEILLRAYNGLGNLQHQQKNFTEAARHFERGLVLARKIGDLAAQGGIETNLGIVFNAQEKPRQALPHLRSALRLLESFGSGEAYFRALDARAALELAEVQMKLNEPEAAQKSLERIQGPIQQEEALQNLRFGYFGAQAKLHWLQGKSAEASRFLDQAAKNAGAGTDLIELKKLENLLQGKPEPREVAITQPDLGAYRPSQESMFLPGGESGYTKLLELTRFINAERNLDDVLKSALQYALELSGAERGLILLLNEQDRMEIRASINTAVNPSINEISSRVAEQVLSTGEMIETDDASNDERFNEYQSVMILKLRSILCLPIHSRHKTVGVLYLDHRFRSKAVHKARHPLLQAFCDQAGIAIENAKLFDAYEKSQAELKRRLSKAEEDAEHYHELLGESAGKIATKYNYDRIVARSKGMHEVFKILDKITETNIAVFINGETGTGKELIAKALHYNNRARAEQRFVAINCGGIPANLIESELFGYKAGAFTGAAKDRKGLFAEADGGTIFLDEVAELDLGLQVKLLRALQEGEITPVGDNRPLKFDARVVSASHKNLSKLIQEGKFREDLYYRICQIRLPLPPLRERREDIPPLAEKFLSDYAHEHSIKKAPKLSSGLMRKFLEYSWPGNIRELENVMRVACALSDGKTVTPKDLPEDFGSRQAQTDRGSAISRGAVASGEEAATKVAIDLNNSYQPELSWEDYEKRIFAKAYEAASFNPITTAQSLDVSPATVYKRIKEFDLNNKSNPLYQEKFILKEGKNLREFLEDIVWAAYRASNEKAYTAIKWLNVSQGHFYSVLKAAKARHA